MNKEDIHKHLTQKGYDSTQIGYVLINNYNVIIITHKAIDRYIKYGNNDIERYMK